MMTKKPEHIAFEERARRRMPFIVSKRVTPNTFDQLVMETTRRFGPDAMPNYDSTPTDDAIWTRAPTDDLELGTTFFFKNLLDATEFKLRFG